MLVVDRTMYKGISWQLSGFVVFSGFGALGLCVAACKFGFEALGL